MPGRPFLLCEVLLPTLCPAEASYFITSNFTFFCLSFTWPRPPHELPLPFPASVVRISPSWSERWTPPASTPQPLGFLSFPSCLWHQERPGQVNWGLSQKGMTCGLRPSLVLCVAPAV